MGKHTGTITKEYSNLLLFNIRHDLFYIYLKCGIRLEKKYS